MNHTFSIVALTLASFFFAIGCGENGSDDESADVAASSEDAIVGDAKKGLHRPGPSTLEFHAIRVAVASHVQTRYPSAELVDLTISKQQPLRVIGNAKGNTAWAFVGSTPQFANPTNGNVYALAKYDPATCRWSVVQMLEASSALPREELAGWVRKYALPSDLIP